MTDEPAGSELEDQLRQAAARLDPVPPDLLQAAANAFAWRGVGTDVAELEFDSLLDPEQGMLVRGAAEPRLISFRAGELAIEIEVTAAAGERSVLGQIVPARPALVDIRRPQGTVTVEADELGRFSSGPLPAGPVSLRLRAVASPPPPAVVTDWVTI